MFSLPALGPALAQPVTDRDRLLREAENALSESQRLQRAGDYREEQAPAERCLELRRKILGDEDPLTAEALDNLARRRNDMGRYGDAEGFAKEALRIREKAFGAESAPAVASRGILGEIYGGKGDLAQAQAICDRNLELAAGLRGADELAYASALLSVARIAAAAGNYSRAEQVGLQALEITERKAGKESLAYGDAVYRLANTYLRKGDDNVRSEEALRRALEIREKVLGSEHPAVAEVLNDLGLIQYRRRDYPAAEATHLRALAIREKTLGPEHPHLSNSLNNLGLVYWRQRNYPKAREAFQKSVELCEKAYGPESLPVAQALGNLGIIAKETGDYEAGESYYKRAVAIREKLYGLKDRSLVIPVESLGILYADKGDYDAAEPFLLRALQITEATVGPDHPDVVRHFNNLVKIYWVKGDREKAVQAFERIRSVEEKDLQLNLAVGSERQKLTYFEWFAQTLEKIISYQAAPGLEDPAARDLAATALLQRKGRVLDAMGDSLASMRERSSPADRASFDELRDATSRLANLVLNGPRKGTLAEHQKQIEALTKQREELEDRLDRSSLGYFERSSAVTLPAVQAAIPPDAALVEFAVYRPYDPKQATESEKKWGEPRYVVYVIPSRGEVSWKDLGSAAEIDAAIAAFRRSLRDQSGGARRAARDLDEKVMRPVRPLIGSARRLLLSPDGQLDLIPFEALLDERGRYLVESYTATYLSTSRDLLRLEAPRESRSGPLVVADPAFGEPSDSRIASGAGVSRRSITTGADLSSVYFAPLAGTAEEARTIRSLFPNARVLTGRRATKATLKKAEAPRILHIATHGFFLQDSAANPGAGPGSGAAPGETRSIAATSKIDNPLLRSGLALTGANLSKGRGEDGILTALEAANLNLWGTKLVTLSACDTGVGEVRIGEGVYGLRRAFVLAGAETLVMSLWPVSDRVTREMMTAYYGGLKKGLGRGEALRRTQLAMLKRKGREHPFYWASFIQSGEWANLDGRR